MTYRAVCNGDLNVAMAAAAERGIRVVGGRASGRRQSTLIVRCHWDDLAKWFAEPNGSLTFYGPSK